MTNVELPANRVMSKAFKEKGRDDVVKIDVLRVKDGELLKLSFESVTSPWRQGVWLKTDGGLTINEENCVSARIWYDSAPHEVLIHCRTEDGMLHIYNIWDRGKGPESQAWSSGMVVEEIPNGCRYRCNDIGFDGDFSKLVFRIERVNEERSTV